MNKKLDLRGLKCPQPLIQTKTTLQEMTSGVLEIIVDNDAARDNILKFASFKGCEAVVESEREGEFVIRITKGQPEEAAPAEAAPEESPGPRAEPTQPQAAGRVLFITTARIGDDNDALARELMVNFFDVLTQVSNPPAKIIFMNAGVTLTSEGSPILEALHDLEGQGVEILSCGRCLEYLHLKDKLRVGTISNMFEIAEILMAASSVVKL